MAHHRSIPPAQRTNPPRQPPSSVITLTACFWLVVVFARPGHDVVFFCIINFRQWPTIPRTVSPSSKRSRHAIPWSISTAPTRALFDCYVVKVRYEVEWFSSIAWLRNATTIQPPPNAKNSIFPILKTKPPRDPLVDFDSPNAVDC